jgi:D-amino peptidase
MKWYILTDLEGACRVDSWKQCVPDEPDPYKLAAKGFLTAEVNAAVAGLYDADAGAEVYVLDGHGNGGIDMRLLDGRAWLISGRSKRPNGLDGSFAGELWVGQHAMAGTPAATLCHTQSHISIEFFELNGREMGEFGCRAAMAARFGVPPIFLSGDDKATLEAEALVPGIVTAVTKIGLGVEAAMHRPPDQVHADIRAGAKAAALRCEEIVFEPLRPPYRLVTRVLPGCDIEGYLRHGPWVRRLDERTVEAVTDDLCELWI